MLTVTQRAERATKRRNKKIAQAYPLFAEQFAVTVKSQVERLEKQADENVKYFERLHKQSLEAYNRAMRYKEIARVELTAEKFAEMETRYERIYGGYGKWSEPQEVGHKAADWWWCALRDNGSRWAQEHCPNAQFHEMAIYQRAGQCPTCKRHLTPAPPDRLRRDTASAISLQISFFADDLSPSGGR